MGKSKKDLINATMSKLNFYSIFHLNLAYSSLPESRAREVIERCYWPLLRLSENLDVKLGIEASGYTLERIQEIDPVLLDKLKFLVNAKKCEFIGSGYAQLIGPLVPTEVNVNNLKIGNELYESFLGTSPTIAYINEQAYSRSLVEHYRQAGFEAIIMEWNNPVKFHPEWPDEYQYYPQIATAPGENKIPVIWNNSIAFQKFQRYASGEIELDEYARYLRSHRGQSERFFPLYGSDAEVFDFRTLRYQEETPIIDSGEWHRIGELFNYLLREPDFSFILPGDVLKKAPGKISFNELSLESSDQPIPVKKRDTYNPTRWALTGRDTVGINTKCYQIYDNLIKYQNENSGESRKQELLKRLWKELCYLWGSDFRTHITEERFAKYKLRLDEALKISNELSKRIKTLQQDAVQRSVDKVDKKDQIAAKVFKQGRNICVETKSISARFNLQKGLAIESLVFKDINGEPLIGTLESGYYKDVSFAEDFFSGHTVIEIPLQPKIVDLKPVAVELPEILPHVEYISIQATIQMSEGVIYKQIDVFNNLNRIDLYYTFDLKNIFPASFRSCILTFNPQAFNLYTLYYACHNGGNKEEVFNLDGDFRAGHLLSHLVSSRSVLGNTNGHLEIGDAKKSILIVTNPSQLAALPMIHFEHVDKDNYFLRLFYSLGEFDETSLLSQARDSQPIIFSATIIAQNNQSARPL